MSEENQSTEEKVYTEKDLISFGNSLLKKYTEDVVVSHADRLRWQDEQK